MAIAALLLWMITAGVGVYLLMVTIIARRAHAPATSSSPGGTAAPAAASAPFVAAAVPAPATSPALSRPGTTPPAPAPPTGSEAAGNRVAGPGEPPPIPRVRVVAGPGDHPLLEFSHPALAITGLGLWLAYTVTRYPAFGWISFALLLVTIGAGLGWLAGNSRVRQRHARSRSGPGVSHGLILAHGAFAATTFVLAVLTVLTLSRF